MRAAGKTVKGEDGFASLYMEWTDRRKILREIRLHTQRSLDVLSHDSRMPSGDTQQSDRRALRTPPSLFPVSEHVNADAHGKSELYLGEPDKEP